MKEFKMKINGNEYFVNIETIEDTQAKVEVNGTIYNVELDKPMRQAKPIKIASSKPASTKSASAPKTKLTVPAAVNPAATVKTPLPGVIIDVCCKVGDEVKTGQKLLVLEAMKMENNINAESNGKIIEVKVNKGDSVLEGDDLVVLG